MGATIRMTNIGATKRMTNIGVATRMTSIGATTGMTNILNVRTRAVLYFLSFSFIRQVWRVFVQCNLYIPVTVQTDTVPAYGHIWG